MTEGKPHHMTLKKLVKEGTLTQALADEVRSGGQTVESAVAAMQERSDEPSKSTSRNSKDDRSRPCLACGETVASGKRFHPGCDMKMHRQATEYVRGERELSEEALAYITDSGKLGKARERVLAEDEKAAHAEDKQRKREAARAAKQSQ